MKLWNALWVFLGVLLSLLVLTPQGNHSLPAFSGEVAAAFMFAMRDYHNTKE